MTAYRKSILFRLNGLVLAAVLPALAVILFGSWKHHRQTLESSRANLAQLTQAVAFQHEGQVQGLNLLLTTLSQVPCVRNVEPAECERLFKALIEKNPFLHNIFLAAPDGRVISSGIPLPPGYSAAGKKYFREAIHSGRFSAGEYEPGHANWHPPFNFCLPIRNGQVQGVLVGSLNLDVFAGFCRNLKLPEGAVFNLSDQSGMLVYRFPRHDTVIPGTPDRPDLRTQVTGPAEEGTFFGIGRDNIRRLLAFKRLRLSPDREPYFYIRLTVPERTIKTILLRDERNSLLLLALSTLAALSASWVLGGIVIGRRMKQLVDATGRLGRGELTAKTGIPHDGSEIGQVAASFDEMAGRLETLDCENRNALAELQSILQTALDGFLVADREGRILNVNDAYCNMSGYSREALLGMRVPDIEDAENREGVARHIAAIIQKGGDRFETRHRRRDGRTISLEVSVRYLEAGGGKLISFLRDITDQKQAEEERIRLQAQMQNAQKLECLGVMAGGIAHDFNNLLMVIMGNIDVVLSGEEPATSRIREKLAEADKAAQRASDLCRQMLAYAGIGQFSVDRVDLGALVSEMAPLLEMSISKKAIFRQALAPDLPAVSADHGQLRQVVLNLVVNASEALDGKDGEIAVSTGVREVDQTLTDDTLVDRKLSEGRYAWVAVRDNGGGMTPETLSKIFDPFYSTKFTGRGLGMAAVLGIVRAHGGGIGVESRPGTGTTVTVFLPAAKTVPLAHGPALPDESSRSCTILLVDDEPMVRKVGAEMLSGLGFNVIEAADGLEAVELFRMRRSEISLVILDLTMPRMGGEEALKLLREIDPEVPVLVSSGYSEEANSNRFSTQPGVGFIAKPYRISDLGGRILSLIENR